MFLTGPDVLKQVTNEEVTFEQLGGANTHAAKSGVASGTWANELDALAGLRTLLSYLPSSNRVPPPRTACADPTDRRSPDLDSIVPDSEFEGYDMMDVLETVVDDREIFEVHKGRQPFLCIHRSNDFNFCWCDGKRGGSVFFCRIWLP
jgi:propionyl-CoA carboxylase beta chain